MTGYDQAGLDGTLTYVSFRQNFSLQYASNLNNFFNNKKHSSRIRSGISSCMM